MRPPPPEPPKDFSQDLKVFASQPAQAKELALLKDRAEKATGREGVALDQLIRDRSKKGDRTPRDAAMPP